MNKYFVIRHGSTWVEPPPPTAVCPECHAGKVHLFSDPDSPCHYRGVPSWFQCDCGCCFVPDEWFAQGSY